VKVKSYGPVFTKCYLELWAVHVVWVHVFNVYLTTCRVYLCHALFGIAIKKRRLDCRHTYMYFFKSLSRFFSLCIKSTLSESEVLWPCIYQVWWVLIFCAVFLCYVCVMCTLWSDNTCVFTRFYSVKNANTQLIWSSEQYM
jgi:hypothetical protein